MIKPSSISEILRTRSVKRVGKILLALALTGLLTPASQAAGRVKIRLATIAPKDTSYHQQLMRMASEWQKLSGGAVQTLVYAGGTQGGESAMVDKMVFNRLQAGLLTTTGLSKLVPDVSGLQGVPLMYRSLEEYDYVRDKMEATLSASLEAKGFKVLFWTDTGFVRFFSKQPMLTPDDLRGMKVFAWAGQPETIRVYQAARLNPIALETADIVPGLHTGLIDAVPMPPFAASAGKVYQAAPHMLDLPWVPLVGAAVVNKQTWDDIDPALRPKLLKVAAEIGEEITRAGRKENEESVASMKDRWGLTVHHPNASQVEQWEKAIHDIYPEIVKGSVPKAILDEAESLLKTYRSGNR